MNITQISYHYRPIVGGQEVYIRNLQQLFESAGYRSRVIQPMKHLRANDTLMAPRLPGIDRLIPGSDEWIFLWSTYLTKQLALKHSDVVVAHYAVNALLHRKYARKTIVLSHGVEWHEENMQWYDRLHKRAAQESFGRNPLVVNDTHYLRTLGADMKPGEKMFCEVMPQTWFIPNCVDTSYFIRVKAEVQDPRKITILVPRQITPDRGIDLAIRAFERILRQRDGAVLRVVGRAHPPGYLDECRRLAQSLGVFDHVIFESHVRHEDMPALYSSATVTLIPTLRREGTSLSALESMSCGTATVSTNVAGLADLPTVQARAEPDDLAGAVLAAIRDHVAIGAQQQKTVQQTFNIENWGRSWLEVIRAAAAN